MSGLSVSYEERNQAVIDGVEGIDPEFILHLPSSTLKLVLSHFLNQTASHRRILQRPDALRLIDEAFPSAAVVLTLGGTIREMLAVVGRQPNHLYSLDAMGQTLAIGLGLALGVEGQPRGERLIVLEDPVLLGRQFTDWLSGIP